jgi:diguanylate cyclase (GGDEF)-like protein/PAS domain S-box-containing protein
MARSSGRLWSSLAEAGSELRRWMPAHGLRDEDWAGRHRLLTWVLVVSTPLLTAVGAATGTLDRAWMAIVGLICACTLGAIFLPPRRLPSMCVALGLAIACMGFVTMLHGLTEAHFTFFIAIGALALYRDWAPFGVFLVATVAHHTVAGVWHTTNVFNHGHAVHNPLLWAAAHGAGMLAMAATQVIAWRLAEVEELRADADLTQTRAQFQVSFDETPVPMVVLTPQGRVLQVNGAYQRWLELPDIPAAGLSLDELPITPVDADVPMLELLLQGTQGGAPIERTYRHTDGRVMIVEVHLSPVRDPQGEIRLVVAHCLDVTQQRQHEAELRRKIREDSLTGLLARAAFEGDLLALLARGDEPVCVIYIGVDRFKAVNDGYGHGVGDAVLRTLADRLRVIAPEGALLARLGGDEFALAVPGDEAAGALVGQTIVDSCRTPFTVAGGHLQVTVSVGLSMAEHSYHAEQAVISADAAMYAAKQTGRDQLMAFDDDMRLANGRRIAAEMLLREALDGDRARTMPVWFQPIVALDSRRVVGAEALVRLCTAEGDLVSPGVFIPAAEETGLVVQIGEHVLQTALTQLMRWGHRLPYVSVNVSPRQLSEANFLPMLTRCLQESGLKDWSRLVLEITETSLLNTSVDLTALLNSIKALGVRLALDDFGTGYSSLTWLKAVPADIVKLDRSFVAGLSHDKDKASIISAVLWLATSLRMSVVAEGVEDVEDWIALERANCPAVQGFLFSRPVRPEDLDKLLMPPDVVGDIWPASIPRPLPMPWGADRRGPAAIPTARDDAPSGARTGTGSLDAEGPQAVALALRSTSEAASE